MDKEQIALKLGEMRERYVENTSEYEALIKAERIIRYHYERSRIASLYMHTINTIEDILNISVGVCGLITLYTLIKICVLGQVGDLLTLAASGLSALIFAEISKFITNWA